MIERDLPILMDDGNELRADVYRSDTSEPVPVILNHGPYGKGIPVRDGAYAGRYQRLVGEHPEILEGSSGEYLTWEPWTPERWVPAGYAVVPPVATRLGVASSTSDCGLFMTLRAFRADGTEVDFAGASGSRNPLSQGWLRASQRELDTARSLPYRPYHAHDERQPLEPGRVYEVEVEL